jgi:hypothetical protein
MGDWFDIPNRSWYDNINHIVIVMPIYIKRVDILRNNEATISIKYAIHHGILDEKIQYKITYLNAENSRVEKTN